MNAQILIIGYAILSNLFDGVLDVLADNQRKLPLPDVVADVYDAEEYANYLAYMSERKRAQLVHSIVDTIVLAVFIFSGFFVVVDNVACGNVYAVVALTYLFVWAVATVERTALSYYLTFVVDEKYGLNKQSIKGFVKDTALGELSSLIVTLVFTELVAFIGENLPAWTGNYSIGLFPAFGISAGIAAAIAVFLVGALALEVFVMMKKYTFEPLPEGELRSDIERLLEGSKKKVREIYVYDESSKSTEKNAFLMRIPVFRFFAIADNFLNENSHRELLAVLSHEVGHLKHKKNAWNYISYAFFVVLFIGVAFFIAYPTPMLFLVDWTQASFGIQTLNYWLIMIVLGAVIRPVTYAFEVFMHCKGRAEEYEADREAVRNGYARELEETLKRVNGDELMTVNPHPVIEFLEYDHPGLVNRVTAMRTAAGEM